MTAWTSERLDSHHELDGFECGKPRLDDWLTTHARRSDAAGATRTYVWTEVAGAAAVAYFAITPTQVQRHDLPSKSLAGDYSTVPGYLIARLALSTPLQGQGLGGELLLDALERTVAAAAIGGGRLIVLDAIDQEAREFYRRHDFTPVEDSMRLYLKVSTAAKALGASPDRPR